MKKKHLLLGALLVGSGILLSSPLFRSRVETDLRERVENSLATSPPEDKYRDVHVAEVDHLDVSLNGHVPTEQHRTSVRRYVQDSVPGVGRVATDHVAVRLKAETTQPILDADSDSEETPSADPQPLVNDTESSPSTTEPSTAVEQPPVSPTELAAPTESPQSTVERDLFEMDQNDAAPENTTELQADNAIPSTDDPFEVAAPEIPCNVDVRSTADSIELNGVVDTNETKQQLGDAASTTFPNATINNALTVDAKVAAASWSKGFGALLTTLREAEATDWLIDIDADSATISGEVPDEDSLKLVGDTAEAIFDGGVTTSKLSVFAPAAVTEPTPEEVTASKTQPEPGPLAPAAEQTEPPQAIDDPPPETIAESTPDSRDASPTQDPLPTVADSDPPTKTEIETDPSTKPSPIAALQKLLDNRTIVLGDPNHLDGFVYNQGAKPTCPPSSTSTSTLPSSSASSAYSAEPLVHTPVGLPGVTVAHEPNASVTSMKACVPKSTKPKPSQNNSKRCLRNRR